MKAACARARERLSLLLDGELGVVAERRLRAHLEDCPGCASLFAELGEIRRSVHALPRPDLPEPDALFAKLREALAVPEGPSAARAPSSSSPRFKPRAIGGIAAVAAAAALAIGALSVSWPLARRSVPGVASLVRTAPAAAKAGGGAAVMPVSAPAPSPVAPSDDELLARAVQEIAQAEDHYQSAVAQLTEIARRERTLWPPSLAAELAGREKALAAEVARCSSLAKARPDDLHGHAALAAAYREQIAFLQDAISRGELAALGGEAGGP